MHVPLGSTTGDRLEGQWHLKRSSFYSYNVNGVSVLMIVMRAHARDEVNWLVIWSGGWEVVTLSQGTDKLSSSCPGVGGQWSRGVKIHFIYLVESVSFKENRPICNIYTQENTCSKCEAYLLLPINNNDTVETVLPQSIFLVFIQKNRILKKEHFEWNPLYKNTKQN